MTHNPRLSPIGIHPHRKSANPHVPVIAFLPGDFPGTIGTPHPKPLARTIGKFGTRVALVEIPKAVRPPRDRVQTVVVVAPQKAREKHLPLVDGGIKFPVAIGVRVHNQVRRLGHDNLVIQNGNPQGREEPGLLHKSAHLIGLA